MFMYIYYVAAIDIAEITANDLKKEYEIHKIRYNKTEDDLSYKKFLQFMASWKHDKYSVSSFISSYHLTKEEALEYAINNIGDINEAGAYPYAGVVQAPVVCSYYNTEQNPNEDFIILKYNFEIRKYEIIDSTCPEYKYILQHLWGMISG